MRLSEKDPHPTSPFQGEGPRSTGAANLHAIALPEREKGGARPSLLILAW
jgi:hypothetical protein